MSTRILIIEDEEGIRDTLTELLQLNGYEVRTASNGLEALLNIRYHRPEVIITDLMMPVMDGIEFLRKLKKDPNWNHVPVIMISAKSQPEDRLPALQSGADAYLIKPFEIKELATLVKEMLTLKKQDAGIQATGVEEFKNPQSPAFISHVEQYLDEHPHANLPELAEHFELSQSGFKKKLKRLSGKSVTDFTREYKLEKARQYLSNGNRSVSEVALLTGFASASHFSNVFKKHFGEPPSVFSEN